MNATGNKTPGWTSLEEEAAKVRSYQNECIRRYLAGEYLTKLDKRDARRWIKDRKAEASSA